MLAFSIIFIDNLIFIKVASFGGYMLKENIMTLSFAPRDSHKAQIQFALERGVPAFVAMLGTRRLPFPAYSFDLVHCSRCLIPFTAYSEYLILIMSCMELHSLCTGYLSLGIYPMNPQLQMVLILLK